MNVELCMSCTGPQKPDCNSCKYNRVSHPDDYWHDKSFKYTGLPVGPCLREICYVSCVTCQQSGTHCFYKERK